MERVAAGLWRVRQRARDHQRDRLRREPRGSDRRHRLPRERQSAGGRRLQLRPWRGEPRRADAGQEQAGCLPVRGLRQVPAGSVVRERHRGRRLHQQQRVALGADPGPGSGERQLQRRDLRDLWRGGLEPLSHAQPGGLALGGGWLQLAAL